MELEEYKAITEGLLFAAGEEGITKKKLTNLLELDTKTFQSLLEEMIKDYQSKNRGLTIMDSQGTLHLTTKPEHASYYKRLLDSPGSTRLSQAALETLAIIAYQQPITRIEVDDLRGVKSDRAIQTLVNRSLIEEKGRKDAIGRPILYGTTKDFLIYFGLTSIEELPPLSELKQGEGEEEGDADLFFEKFNEDPFGDD
ncbi:SMC-Scp complex subunit ScpB [Halobacillus litoralis]|uniref:Segregation and condensation protein B n=1 Tax=Halobacillus litoralis TaxID=45668 RepID=A0A845FC83_9BACI|nr:SMC-Scp complex subunit ScpB [Halobacillus litoralis]MYL71256.1 SMC-Scp complex subunit ScpB [Halobacillus litoralis]